MTTKTTEAPTSPIDTNPAAHELDRDTALSELAPGRYGGQVSAAWNVGPVPNGGYVMALGLAAMQRALPGLDPLSISAHYLRPAVPGPLEIAVEVVKQGRSLSTACARLSQAGREITRVLATLGTLGNPGPRFGDAAPPPMPGVDDAMPRPAGAPLVEIAHRFEQRFDPETVHWAVGTRADPAAPGTRAELRAYQRLADGRAADPLALPIFADSMPPPIFAVIQPGWVPTIELTVHVRARPVPGWLLCQFRTRFLFGGYLEEDGEIWDASGQLVALSRQLASVPSRTW